MNEAPKTYSILVVEDNFSDYEKITSTIADLEFKSEIKHAKNFKEATSILSSEDKFFDAVLLDLTLPDISKYDVISQIMDLVFFCPIIVLTNNHDIKFALKSISRGISDYLVKDEITAASLYKSITCATERKKIFFSYELAKTRYSDLFHLSPLPMWVYDLGTFSFLDVNDAAIKKYGFSKEEFLAMTIKEIRPVEDYPLFDEGVHSFSQYRDNFKKRYVRHQKKNGAIVDVEIQSNIIYYNSQKAKLVMANDITKQMQHIKTIEDQNKSLKEIAWTHSHVVRAPLAKMMSIIDFMKESNKIPTEYEELLDHFFKSGTELDTIIRDIVKKTETMNKINKNEL
ncbi:MULTISPECIES: response regulator [unclassified Flavobacterium]|uniref:response regulator n=1 Tax=unclassified Flavobacterium TaxID=196869 RepID=UPI003F93B819